MSGEPIVPEDVVVVAVPDCHAFDFYSRTTGRRIGWTGKSQVAELGVDRTPEMILGIIADDLPAKALKDVRKEVPGNWIFEDIRMLLDPEHTLFMDTHPKL